MGGLTMPKSDNQKGKILYILDYLQKNSHQAHPVRASELTKMLLEQHNIVCERKTIYSDIAALQDYGVDIVSVPGKNGGYYIASRNFELPDRERFRVEINVSARITQRTAHVRSGKRIEYYLHLNLTEIKSGIGLGENVTPILKRRRK